MIKFKNDYLNIAKPLNKTWNKHVIGWTDVLKMPTFKRDYESETFKFDGLPATFVSAWVLALAKEAVEGTF